VAFVPIQGQEATMKYVIQWENRDISSSADDSRKLLEAFSKWSPAASNILQFLAFVDGSGGLSIVDTDDPVNIMKDVTKFAPWLAFTVTPVMDIMDAIPIYNEAIEFVEGAGL
jgi:hypothetical protein